MRFFNPRLIEDIWVWFRDVTFFLNRWFNTNSTTSAIQIGSDFNSGNYLEIESDGTLVMKGNATVWDDMLFEIRYEDTDAHPTAGVLGAAGASQTGTFANLARRDGILWTITEGGSAGNMMEITFEDISQVPVMYFTGIYNGTVAHAANLQWRVYNYVNANWNDVLTFTWANAVQYIDVAVSAGFTTQHISNTGQVRIAVNHGSTVVAGHTLSLDEVYLIEDNQPQSVVYKGGRVLSFRNTGYDMVHGRVQFRHSYKIESNFNWHVHFVNLAGTITDGQTVVFTLSRSFAPIYGVFPTPTTLTATFTNNAAWRATLTAAQATALLTGTTVKVDSHLIAAGASPISGTGLNISSVGLLELRRTAGTYTDNIGVLYSDFHIEQDTLASRSEFTK